MRVFITGASSGIGAALSRAFAARGDTLGLVARNPDKLASFVKMLPFAEKHVPYAVDVTDRTDLLAAARDFEAKGETDIVIACAGISIGVKTEYFEDLDVLERIYKTNVFAMASTFHGFIAPMKSRGRGQFVGIGSVAGIRGLPGSEAYCSSKAAVISYLESLRNDVRPYGISVTTLSPGFVKTPLTAKNPYKMPFLLEPDAFARVAICAIDAKTSYKTIPWQMGVLAKLMRILPNGLFDACVAHRKQKPRDKDLHPN